MSDCFDHEADAWASYDRSFDEVDYDTFHVIGRHGKMDDPDPNYFHSWQSIDSIEKETDKAYLVKIEFVTFWIAKSLVRDQRLNMIFVHTDIFNDCLEKALKERKQMERLNLVAPVLDPFAKYRK